MTTLALALGLTLLTQTTDEPKTAFESLTLDGRVVLLADAVEALGLRVDVGPIAQQVVLKSHDGSITPILPNDASRAFFTDERLRDRRSRLVGRRYEGLPYFQITSFQIEDNGKLRTPEYYCDVCLISVRAPQACPCCQGEMVLRMKPEGR